MIVSKPSATVLRGLCALAFSALLPLSCYAAIISGTWDFTAGSYTGSFSFTNFDTTINYSNSTGAGFAASLDDPRYDTSNVFSFAADTASLSIGGSESGATGVQLYPDSVDTGLDWFVQFRGFPASPTFFQAVIDLPALFVGDTARVITNEGSVSLQSSVPEPETLTLLGLGLAGMGLSRRRKVQVHLI